MTIVRLTVYWTIFFIWGWAYMMPAVPMCMLLASIYARGRRAIWPIVVGACFVWLSYYVEWP